LRNGNKCAVHSFVKTPDQTPISLRRLYGIIKLRNFIILARVKKNIFSFGICTEIRIIA